MGLISVSPWSGLSWAKPCLAGHFHTYRQCQMFPWCRLNQLAFFYFNNFLQASRLIEKSTPRILLFFIVDSF